MDGFRARSFNVCLRWIEIDLESNTQLYSRGKKILIEKDMFVHLSLFILQNTWLNEAIRIYGHFGPLVHYGRCSSQSTLHYGGMSQYHS